MNQPNDLPPDWLAGFADRELSPHEQDRAERYLADHPELRSLLEDQEALGPANTDFWHSVAPPTPTADDWNRVQSAIAVHVIPTRTWRVAKWFGALALLSSAALVLLAINMGQRPFVPPIDDPIIVQNNEPDEPLGVLQLAVGDDIEIYCLPEEMASLIITGSHPLGSELLLLARSDEIEFHGIGADPEGRFPEVTKDPNAIDPPPPVIWAPQAP